MSLSGALSNAVTGLNAASRSAQMVSSNLANVLTEGYGRREIELEARYGTGAGGVALAGVSRHQNPALASEMRMTGSELAYSDSLSGFHTRLERLVGTPDQANSLSLQLADLEESLISAASRPDIPARLDSVVTSAGGLTQRIGEVSAGIQDMRREADSSIARAVETLNGQLNQVVRLNGEIARSENNGFDASGLKDQRHVLISGIAEWIPLKEVDRGGGVVALYTTGGAQLVDGPAATLGFDPSQMIVPHMTLDAGLLSGLTLNDTEVRTDSETGPIRGGKLAALFEARDEVLVAAQAELDAVARDLVERFQDASLDSTRAPGAAGLLTDNGLLFDPLDETGLSGRLTLNALVDPALGGESWRLRDGLGVAAQGPVGNAALLQDYQSALTQNRSVSSGSSAGHNSTASGLFASLSSDIGADRLKSDTQLAFAATRASEIKALVQSEGVDSDQEMQKLMLIEQAYAANAQMLQTVDEMMDALMRAI